jgi:hypothetical protein
VLQIALVSGCLRRFVTYFGSSRGGEGGGEGVEG